MMSSTSCVTTMAFSIELSYGLVEVLDVVCHVLPALAIAFQASSMRIILVDTLQSPHLLMNASMMMMVTTVKRSFIVLHGINFKDDKSFGEQINVLIRIEQEVVPTALCSIA